MRKTRSRHNQVQIKVETENKGEDNVASDHTARKRGRRKIQPEKDIPDPPSAGSQEINITENVNATNDNNEEASLATNKLQKTPTKKLKPRKVVGTSKKEFSKSNFSMTKILQNNSPKELETLKGKYENFNDSILFN